jgi:NAD(P)-dependent dehydrogenase (short-subunit alcohol dehydrogenase family)
MCYVPIFAGDASWGGQRGRHGTGHEHQSEEAARGRPPSARGRLHPQRVLQALRLVGGGLQAKLSEHESDRIGQPADSAGVDLPPLAGPLKLLVEQFKPKHRLKGLSVIGACNVSKAADFQLARNLAAEWGRHNVRVNCIAPGLVRTDFARLLWGNPQTLKAITAATPLGRIGEPDEIAGAAVFLAPKASSFMTGQTIVVDGGATIAG